MAQSSNVGQSMKHFHPHPKAMLIVKFCMYCVFICMSCSYIDVSPCHDPLHHFLSVPAALLPFTVYKTSLTVTAATITPNLPGPSFPVANTSFTSLQLCDVKLNFNKDNIKHTPTRSRHARCLQSRQPAKS
ncbi:hypothetical protein E3U43_015110 [Larimichthys crocea]|uniref:Uncharacterized protein n=1 Tax=Larimichthys crocea TaxID=215358 RepID=A0ACD3RP63_LARCR|nr:hypothetical protein E3U43_015110 [Larimichthys crocea]